MHIYSSNMLCHIFMCPLHEMCLGFVFEVMRYTIPNFVECMRERHCQGLLFPVVGVVITESPLSLRQYPLFVRVIYTLLRMDCKVNCGFSE